MKVPVRQYLRPNGDVRDCETEIGDSQKLRENYDLMVALGCNLAAELIETCTSVAQVSLTIEDRGKEVDVDCEVVENGHDVPKGIEALLTRFPEAYKAQEAEQTEAQAAP